MDVKMKASVYIATTVDGYIAQKDGSIDFLNQYQSSASDADGDMGFADFLNSVDLLIMGRKTFDQVISFGEDMWPYGNRQVGYGADIHRWLIYQRLGQVM